MSMRSFEDRVWREEQYMREELAKAEAATCTDCGGSGIRTIPRGVETCPCPPEKR